MIRGGIAVAVQPSAVQLDRQPSAGDPLAKLEHSSKLREQMRELPAERIVITALVWLGIAAAVWFRFWRGPRQAKPAATERKTAQVADPTEPTVEFGFRGEDITYRLAGRTAGVSFTYGHGPRIYSDSIREWSDRSPLSAVERRDVLERSIALVRRSRQKPVVVINADDPLAAEWRAICDEHRADIAGVEMTSDAETRAFHKKMFMDILAAGKGVMADGVPLRTEEDVDRHIARVYPPREPGKGSRASNAETD